MLGECTCKSVLLLITVASISQCLDTFASGCIRSLDRDEFAEEQSRHKMLVSAHANLFCFSLLQLVPHYVLMPVVCSLDRDGFVEEQCGH